MGDYCRGYYVAMNAIRMFSRPLVETMGPYGEVLQAFLVLTAIWHVLYFFYKRKIFFKV